MDFDTQVKLAIYEQIADRAIVPTSEDIAHELRCSDNEAQLAFARLASKRLLVLEPNSPSQIRMAPPFSGIKTPFPVLVGDKEFHANCVWDAFGVAAALHDDAIINTVDGFSGEPIILEVRDNKPLPHTSVAHFAVPAAHWWDDIIYT